MALYRYKVYSDVYSDGGNVAISNVAAFFYNFSWNFGKMYVISAQMLSYFRSESILKTTTFQWNDFIHHCTWNSQALTVS